MRDAGEKEVLSRLSLLTLNGILRPTSLSESFPAFRGHIPQAATIDELRENLKEVLELCLEEYEGKLDELPKLIGLQQIEVAA